MQTFWSSVDRWHVKEDKISRAGLDVERVRCVGNLLDNLWKVHKIVTDIINAYEKHCSTSLDHLSLTETRMLSYHKSLEQVGERARS